MISPMKGAAIVDRKNMTTMVVLGAILCGLVIWLFYNLNEKGMFGETQPAYGETSWAKSISESVKVCAIQERPIIQVPESTVDTGEVQQDQEEQVAMAPQEQEAASDQELEAYKVAEVSRGEDVRKDDVPATPPATADTANVQVFEATAYWPGPGIEGGEWTASGTMVTPWYTIAVDPDVIPLGSTVTVTNLQTGEIIVQGKAEDTGGMIQGNIIDIAMENNSQCNNWGRQDVGVTWY